MEKTGVSSEGKAGFRPGRLGRASLAYIAAASRLADDSAMRIVAISNNPVRLSFLLSLLADAGIGAVVLDEHTSFTEGSIGAITRRLAVAVEDERQALRVLEDAGET